MAWLRGRFLARGSLSLAGGRAHLEFVVAARRGAGPRGPPRRRRGCPPSWRAAARSRRRDLEERASRSARSCGRIGASARAARARGAAGRADAARRAQPRPQRRSRPTSSGPSRRPAGSSTRSTRSTPTAGWPSSRRPSGPWPRRAARRPRRRSSEIAERLELHRSAVQRALDRLERLALHDDEGVGRRYRTRPSGAGSGEPPGRAVRAGRRAPGGRSAGGWTLALWHDARHAPDRDCRQLEDEHHPRRRRRAGADHRVADARGRGHPRHLPAVRVPRRRPRRARGRGRRASAPRTSTTSWPGPTPARSPSPMLAGLATWVILGHSERRARLGETDELIGRKLDRAVAGGLRPILCVGEVSSPTARPAAQDAVVGGQLQRRPRAAATRRRLVAAGLVIAYEPVWAIGTGRNASRRRRRRHGRRDPRDACASSAGATAPTRPRSCTAAASPRRTSASSSPSPRSTARSSAAPRSSPTRWRASSPGPAITAAGARPRRS